MAAKPARIVIAEPFGESGLAVLREHGFEIVSCVGEGRAALEEALASARALIVRSETRVDRALLRGAGALELVARAGAGVDTIDIEAATEAGILVLNVPGANTLAAIEMTFALALAHLRALVPAACALREGRWERAAFTGGELAAKTLGIVGLGRIGSGVAERARAFGMRVLAHDPFFPAGRAEALGIPLAPLHEVLAAADILTLHVPLTPQTEGLLDEHRLGLLKPSALVINTSRGGVIDERALLAALDNGALAGAALDVFAEEPPARGGYASRLIAHPHVLATPHLAASTREAQERIALDLANDVAAALAGAPPSNAVNAPIADAGGAALRAFAEVADRLGRLYPQLGGAGSGERFTIVAEGETATFDPGPLVAAFLSGLLQTTTERRVSVVNAAAIADELGIDVEIFSEERRSAYAATLRVHGGRTIAATASPSGPRLVEIDGLEVDAALEGALILTRHRDVPGVIGQVGTILGDAHVNISAMAVSRRDAGGDAVMVLAVDHPADAPTVERLRALPGLRDVSVVELRPPAAR